MWLFYANTNLAALAALVPMSQLPAAGHGNANLQEVQAGSKASRSKKRKKSTEFTYAVPTPLFKSGAYFCHASAFAVTDGVPRVMESCGCRESTTLAGLLEQGKKLGELGGADPLPGVLAQSGEVLQCSLRLPRVTPLM